MACKPLPGNITIAIQFDEDLWNNYRTCGVYSPEPRAEVYCVRLNFNVSTWAIITALSDFGKFRFSPHFSCKFTQNLLEINTTS